ncbi:MAG: GNAT family N-acetyltransferase [Candidatus Abyssobacteria bacterium SURF_5]|uniref:GNAT family N-acetyltransferase n=1 Tax=Abyssobacteria bacterium (strain SURF_5) TaxID=2093360 RepID=A0A3A4NFE6_ABYX5|nr:MAG: GNAT family N-acetyltransferase [Candidatus Abyssubacteria bacterium SURF_5]
MSRGQMQEAMQALGVLIRKYVPDDRAAVRSICYETGLMGDSMEPYFGCRDLFADYWMNYYTDFEPESAFVAEADGAVVGYLVGCKTTTVQQEVQSTVIIPRIRRKLFTLGYKIDMRFFRFMYRYLRSGWRHEFIEEPITDYPAHLHMNLIKGYRSMGIGSLLIAAYLEYLKSNSVSGIHLGTTTYNKLAVPFYKKWGFRLVSRHPFTMYDGIIPEKIDVLFFVRDLTEAIQTEGKETES